MLEKNSAKVAAVRKLVSLFTVFSFLIGQVLPAYAEITLTAVQEQDTRPEKPATEGVSVNEFPELAPIDASADFLSHDLTLEPVKAGDVQEEVKTNDDYVTDAFETLEQGIDEIKQNDVPAAYLAKNVTIEGLRALRNLGEQTEVGLVVAGGYAAVFSTGNKEFIRGISPIEELTGSPLVQLSSHFHLDGGPTSTDLHDGSGLQYVISATPSGEEVVYVHNGTQILDSITYQEFIDKVNEAIEASRQDADEVRDLLNKYIAAIDNYSENDRIIEPVLFANHEITLMPGQPQLGIFQTSSNFQSNSFEQGSSSTARFNYDVQLAGSFAALSIQFDNFGTGAIETADLSAEDHITFGIASSNTCAVGSVNPCLKVEFEDSTGIKAAFDLRGLTNVNQRFSISKSAIQTNFPTFKLDKVRFINFVLDQGTTTASTRTGTLDLETKGLAFVPSVPTGSAPVTNLAALQPTVNPLIPAGHNTVTSFNQASNTNFNLNYNLANGAVADNSKFAGALMNLSNAPFNLNTSSLKFGIKASGTQTMKIVLSSGTGVNEKKVTLLVKGLNNTTHQIFEITKELVDLAEISGFDTTNITFVSFVVDATVTTQTASGNLSVNTNGIYFTPTAPTTAAAVTDFSAQRPGVGELEPCATANQNPCTSGTLNTITAFNQPSASLFDFTYNLANGSSVGGRLFGGALLNFGAATYDTTTALVLGFRRQNNPTTSKILLDIVDVNGKKVTIHINNLLTTYQNYQITKALLDSAGVPGFDATKIAAIAVVVNDQVTGSPTASGRIFVRTKGLATLFGVDPDPTQNASTISHLSSILHLIKFDSEPPAGDATATLSQTSKTQFKLTYNVTPAGSFVGTASSFDDFGTGPKEVKDLTGQTLVFGVKDAGSPRVILQLEDSTGKKDQVILNAVDGTEKFYSVSTALFDQVDLTKITGIVFLIEKANTTVASSALEVRLGDQPFVPTAVPDPTQNASTISHLSNIVHLINFDSEPPAGNATSSLTQSSKTQFKLTYDVTPAGSFVGTASSFDDFGTVPKEFKDLTGLNLIFGLKDANSPKVTLQLEDANGKKDQVLLTGIDGTERFFKIASSLFDDVDLTKITGIVFLIEKTNTTVASSALEVRLGDQPFVPTAVPDPTQNSTTISHLSGIVHLIKFDSEPPAGDATASLSQTSPTQFKLTYDVTPAGSFVGTASSFDDFGTVPKEFKNLTGLNLIFGLKDANSPKVTLQLEDANGNKDQVLLTGIDGTERFFKIASSLFDDVDLTKITGIVFLIEKKNTTAASSALEVRLGDQPFVPTLTPDPTQNSTTISHLSGIVHLIKFDSDPPAGDATASLSQTSPTQFKLTYDVTPAGSFVGTASSFDDFGTAPKEIKDLTGVNLIFGLKDANSPKVTLQLEDANGNKDQVLLTGIDGTERFFKAATSLFDGVDLTKITGIVFLIEKNNTTVASSALEVRLGDQPFVPVFTPDPTQNASTISHLTNIIHLIKFDSEPPAGDATATLSQTSKSQFKLTYDVTPAGSFVGTASSFDDFGTAPKEFKDLTGVNLIFGLKDANSPKVTLQLEDANGNKDQVLLTGIDGTERFFKVGTSAFESVDLTKITGIVFLIEKTNTTVASSALEVRLGDQPFVPTAVPDPTQNASTISHLADIVHLIKFDSDPPAGDATATLNQTSKTQFKLTYDVTPAGSFVGTASSFDDFGTVDKEFKDLTGLNLIFGLKDANSPKVTLQLEDANGNKDQVLLTGIDGTERFFKIATSLFDDVDLTKITGIVFLIEKTNTTVASSALEVRLGDQPFVPVVVPDPTQNANTISHIDGFFDNVAFGTPAGAGTLNKLTTTRFNLIYDLTAAASFAGTIGTFDDFTTDPKETKDLTGQTFVFGLRDGGIPSKVTLQLEDSTGAKDQVTITGVNATEHFFSVPASFFDDVDLTKITSFVFLVEKANVTDPTSILEVRLGDFIPVVAPDPTQSAATITHFTDVKHLVTFDSDVPNGIVNLGQTSKTEFSLTYDLTPAGSFGGGIISFDDFGTAPKETKDFTGQDLIFGLKDAGAPSKVIVQLEDANGTKSQAFLTGINGTEHFYKLSSSIFTGVDLTKITAIVFVLEQFRLTDTTSKLEIRLGDMPFTPTVAPDPTQNVGTISHFSAFNQLVKFNSASSTVNLIQFTPTRFNLDYDLTAAGSFGGSISAFDDFSTPGKEVADLTDLSLVFGIKDPGAPGLIIQLEDASGKKDQVVLTGIDGTERFFKVATSLFDDVDLANITSIVFLLEKGRVTDPTSTLEVRLGDHPFAPDFSQNETTISHVDDVVHLVTFQSGAPDPDATVNLTQTSKSLFTLDYDLSNAGGFGGSISSFDDFGTPATEVKDLTGQVFIFGLKDAGAPKVILQLEDANGNRSRVTLTNVSDEEHFYRIEAGSFEGVDLTQITGFVFLLEQPNLTDPVSSLQIRIGDQPFVPTLEPDPSQNAGTISHIADIKELEKFDSDAPADALTTLDRISSTRFNLGYDVTPDGSFAGAFMAFDDFGTVPTEVKDLSGQTIVLGLRDAGEPSQVIIQVEDALGNKDQVILTGVDAIERFYSLDMDFLFDDVDLTQVKALTILLQNSSIDNTTSTLEVRLGDQP